MPFSFFSVSKLNFKVNISFKPYSSASPLPTSPYKIKPQLIAVFINIIHKNPLILPLQKLETFSASSLRKSAFIPSSALQTFNPFIFMIKKPPSHKTSLMSRLTPPPLSLLGFSLRSQRNHFNIYPPDPIVFLSSFHFGEFLLCLSTPSTSSPSVKYRKILATPPPFFS